MTRISTSIEDPNYSQKQNQIYIWLRYIGFATWRQIHNVCLSLIEADSLEVKKWYSNYPIFKIFYPLLNAGIFEIAFNKSNNKHGFTVANKVPLFQAASISKKLDFLSVLEGEKQEKLYSPEISKKNGLLMLDTIPPLYDQILSWPIDTYLYKGDEYYTRDFITKKYSDKKIFIDEPNIISAHNNSFSAEYIAIRNKASHMEFHSINSDLNCDALNISCCFIKCDRGMPIFEYDSTKKELSCINIFDYSLIPILIQRALFLHDVNENQLNNQISYLRNGMPFTNIDEITIKLIRKIFGFNAVKIKE